MFSYAGQNKKNLLWKVPPSSEVQGWKLSLLCPTNIHSNSVFPIHREWRSLSKAGAVNFMYHLWNCHRGHVLCSILLQKQVRPFLSSVKRLPLIGSTLSSSKFSVCFTQRDLVQMGSSNIHKWLRILYRLWRVCTACACVCVCTLSLMQIVLFPLCDHRYSMIFALFWLPARIRVSVFACH